MIIMSPHLPLHGPIHEGQDGHFLKVLSVENPQCLMLVTSFAGSISSAYTAYIVKNMSHWPRVEGRLGHLEILLCPFNDDVCSHTYFRPSQKAAQQIDPPFNVPQGLLPICFKWATVIACPA